MVELIIHPGFVKTGTTFFQEVVIKKINNSLSIGKPYTNKLIFKLIKNIFYSNKKFYKKELNKLVNIVILEIKKKNIKYIILSDEILLDSEKFDIKKNLKKLKVFISILKKKINLKTSFLISVRKQEKLIISRYAYIYPVLKKNNKTFENYVDLNINKKSQFFSNLRYTKIEIFIKNMFKSKVYFLPLESLEINKYDYIKILKKIFKNNFEQEKISFKKINSIKKKNITYLKKSNLWHKFYLSLYKINNKIPSKISNKIPLKKNLKNILIKNIKFNISDDKLLYDIKSITKIQKFFIKDNYKLKRKYKINYL